MTPDDLKVIPDIATAPHPGTTEPALGGPEIVLPAPEPADDADAEPPADEGDPPLRVTPLPELSG